MTEVPLIPPNGFLPEDFPSVAVAFIPYNSGSAHEPRADPIMRINDDGWMFIETGNVRLALPDREEWAKFVMMGEALWNTHMINQDQQGVMRNAPSDEFAPPSV